MPHEAAVDPTPLSPAQIRALVAAATRELTWGLRAVRQEARQWRSMAEAIPDASIRADAFHALTRKRGHTDGAALFTILPRRRERALLRLLVAYETIWDFLDNVSERHPTPANGRQLHLALIDALDPARPLANYYRFHPCSDDGGYLVALVCACREGCDSLASYPRVRALVVREAYRARVLGLNHERDPILRDIGLRAWATEEFPEERELSWFELSGGASASLVIHVLLALAAESCLSARDVAEAYAAYWPWISVATTMLDSYVDQAEDAARGNHSYIAHYGDPAQAARRLRESIAVSMDRALRLRDGHRHVVIVGCMIAMYLTKDSARTSELRATTRTFVDAGGSLARLLIPILRAWRLLYASRSA
jgi:tetraprenyl-beta-curcumene synthase